MRDQFIAGLGCFWKCGPMWFTISLDPPPSMYLKKEVQTIGQVASDMTSLLLTCYFRAGMVVESSAQGKELLPSFVHISACRCSYIHKYNLSVVCMLCSGISVSAMHQLALAASSGQTCSFDSFHL